MYANVIFKKIKITKNLLKIILNYQKITGAYWTLKSKYLREEVN